MSSAKQLTDVQRRADVTRHRHRITLLAVEAPQ